MNKVPQRLLAFALVLTGTACGYGGSGTASSSTADQESVKQYLLEHPEIALDDAEIRDAIRSAHQRRLKNRAATDRRAVLQSRIALLQSSLTPVSGRSGPRLTVIEFYDFQCAPCKASYPGLETVRESEPEVRYIYAQLPIYGSYSVMAARAAIAAQRQGQFEEFNHALMTTKTALDMDVIFTTAAEAGLNVEQLQIDMRDSRVIQYLDDIQLLAEALGVTGTPSFIVGDVLLSGGMTADDLRAALERQRVQDNPFFW